MTRHLTKRSSKFTPEEDAELTEYVKKYGEDDWEKISSLLKNRNPRQCRDRWFCYVSPDINREPFTEEEDALLLDLVKKLGFHWVQITSFFKGRTDNQIKNRYNLLKRKREAEYIEEKRRFMEEEEEKEENLDGTEATAFATTDNVNQLISSIIANSANFFSTDSSSLFL